MLKRVAVAAIVAAMAAGPAVAWAETSAPTVTVRSAAMISYEKSGGFAGIRQSITIGQYGEAHVAAAATTADFQLTDEEFRSLRRRLGNVSTWSSSSAGCDVADHFTRTLSYRGRQATRCHELPSDWRSATTQLEGLIASHLTGPS
ncbi:hypothetical protein [Streptosporangium sp. NPDC000396]|uniref:hypothetical protein n=1 Tax=Streptosporangium sp. NPDC000396 TaxID=3366185 RepID=UPI0036A9C6FF